MLENGVDWWQAFCLGLVRNYVGVLGGEWKGL